AILCITEDMILKSNVNENEIGDLVNVGRDIDTVEISILIKEKNPNFHKVSLRSKNYFDVKSIAEVFNGGGHIRAAGCAIEGSLEYSIQSLLNEIKGQL
ncbi:MAG: DHHA1 domain-containing protein, partial [Clostridium sp.]